MKLAGPASRERQEIPSRIVRGVEVEAADVVEEVDRELVALAAALREPPREQASEGAVFLDALRRGGRLSGDLPETRARMIVLVAGVQGPQASKERGTPSSPREEQARAEANERAARIERINQRLAEAFRDGGAIVVGVEPFAADRSSVSAFRAADVASVDAVDRAVGQIALVFALRGEKGAFGFKATAERVLPDSALVPAPLRRPEPAATIPAPGP